ncbi:MAG: hypothetical protein ACP5I7_01400 [Sulfolobales archaeon]
MINEILLLIYVLIITTLYLLYRRVKEETAESKGYTEVFNREFKTISISARLRIIYIQLKLFLLRDSTLYVLILTTLFFTMLMSWSIEPSVNIFRESVVSAGINYAITEDNYSLITQLESSRPLLYIYEVSSDEPYMIKKSGASSDILFLTDTIYLIECLDQETIYRLNNVLGEICSEHKVFVFGKEMPSEGVLIHGGKILDINISSLITISNPYIVSRFYTLYDLLNYKIYNIGTLSYIPRSIILINKDYALSNEMVTSSELKVFRSVVQINLSENQLMSLLSDLEEEMIHNNIRQIVLVINNYSYIFSVSNFNIISYSIVSGVLTLVFISGVFILYIRSFEDHLVKYSESASYSGGTDWISRTSLLIGYFFYGLFIMFLSIALSILVGYFTEQTLYIGFVQFIGIFIGSFIGVIISLVYLFKVLSESSIYQIEKLPTKTFLEIKISTRSIAINEIIDKILNSLGRSEFFQILEKHINTFEHVGKAFLRVIYTYTIGIGVDIYIQVSRHKEDLIVSIDLDPWSIEELPPEALSSVSRMVLSRIQGVLQIIISKESQESILR